MELFDASLGVIAQQIETVRDQSCLAVIKLRSEAKDLVRKSLVERGIDLGQVADLVQQSKQLTTVEHDDWFYQWLRFDIQKLFSVAATELEKELVSEILSDDHFVSLDLEHNCLTYSIGPAIVINDDGDVLDQESGKWFISKGDYSSKEELLALIETHCEEVGCFPGVVRTDYHGNVRYINTKKVS